VEAKSFAAETMAKPGRSSLGAIQATPINAKGVKMAAMRGSFIWGGPQKRGWQKNYKKGARRRAWEQAGEESDETSRKEKKRPLRVSGALS
jgi:hypothetical protein